MYHILQFLFQLQQLCNLHLFKQKIEVVNWKNKLLQVIEPQKIIEGSYTTVTQNFGDIVTKLVFLVNRSNDRTDPTTTILINEDSLPSEIVIELPITDEIPLKHDNPIVLIEKKNGTISYGIK